jgi:hypothetical protein
MDANTTTPVQAGGLNNGFERLLSDETAAAMLGGMNVKTLQRRARNGEIPARKIGRFWYFRSSELELWLRQSCFRPCVCVKHSAPSVS